jgi:hypothetical protein
MLHEGRQPVRDRIELRVHGDIASTSGLAPMQSPRGGGSGCWPGKATSCPKSGARPFLGESSEASRMPVRPASVLLPERAVPPGVAILWAAVDRPGVATP